MKNGKRMFGVALCMHALLLGATACSSGSSRSNYGGGNYNQGGYVATSAEQNKIPATSMTMDKYTYSMVVGDTFQFHVTFQPSDATDQSPVWSSSNISVISIDQNGKATALAEGQSEIMARTSEWQSKLTVTVRGVAPIVKVSASLPTYAGWYSSTGSLMSSARIDTVEGPYTMTYYNGYYLKIKGVKASDYRGSNSSTAVCFLCDIYDSGGIRVIRDKVYINSIFVYDSFSHTISLSKLEGGKTYTLSFSNYNS